MASIEIAQTLSTVEEQVQHIVTKEGHILIKPVAEDVTPASTPDQISPIDNMAETLCLGSGISDKKARRLAATLTLEEQVSFPFRQIRGAWTSTPAPPDACEEIIYIAVCEFIFTAFGIS